MKNIWVLNVKTSLPANYSYSGYTQSKTFAFEDFSKARDVLRAKLKEFAFSINSMFDGNGRLTYLNHYLKHAVQEENDWVDDDTLTDKILKKISDAFYEIFSGKDTCLDIAPNFYTDYMIAATVTDDYLSVEGDDDGPINGYNPDIKTNMFNMQKEGYYYLYIDDCLGQDKYSSRLDIELKKVEIN